MQNSIVCSACDAGNSIITDLDTGEMVCSQCGLVLFDKIQDTKQEWREFPDTVTSKNRKRTGAPTSIAHYDMGLYTMIGSGDKDASGKVLDSTARISIRRLRIWDVRSQASGNKGLRTAFGQLNVLKDKLGLPSSMIEMRLQALRVTDQEILNICEWLNRMREKSLNAR